MATIQRVRRQNVASTVDAGAISRAQQPFQQAAGVFDQFANKAEQTEVAAAKAEVAKANSVLNRSYNTAFDENTTEFAKDPSRSTQAFDSRLRETTDAISGNLTSDRAKQMFAETSQQLSSGYKLKHDKWGDTQIKKNAISDIDTTATEYGNQAYEAGSKNDFSQFLNIQGLTQDVVVAASGIVATDELSKIAETTAKDNATQFVAGMTRDNPDDAIALMDSGKLDEVFSKEEKDGLVDSANVRKKQIKLAQKVDTTARESELLVSLEMPDTDSYSKELEINQLEANGKISKTAAASFRRMVKSQKAVDALTVNEDMAGIVTQIYDLNAISEIDASGYLDGVESITNKIADMRAKGRLSAGDAVKMQNQMKTLTASKVAGATQDIAIFYSEASEAFQRLPSEDRGLAMREMFYATEGNFDLGKQEMVDKANNIVDTINKSNRDSTLRNVTAVVNAKSVRSKDDALFIKTKGFTDTDIQETMTKYGLTEQQVIQKLRGN